MWNVLPPHGDLCTPDSSKFTTLLKKRGCLRWFPMQACLKPKLGAFCNSWILIPDSPWRTESQFLEAMAAICTLFQDELTKTTFSGPTLHRLLINLTSPVKIQWLFNDTRYRHACAPSQTPLLPSGTTSNEPLHHELNSWFHEIDAWRRLCMFSLLS